MSETKAVHIPKTRQGGTFTDPKNVNLHSNDFTWKERMEELTAEEKKHFDEYLQLWNDALEGNTTPQQVPPEPVAENGKPTPAPWEAHYSSSRHHFPLKNYIIHAFPVLKGILDGSKEKPAVLECGCGTGSTLLPLMKHSESKDSLFVGFDVSASSVKYFSEHEVAKEFSKDDRLFLFAHDAAATPQKEEATEPVAKRARKEAADAFLETTIATHFPRLTGIKYDAVFLIFVLSALPTAESMRDTLRQLRHVMKPDGVLLFRDYALPDHNFFRFIAKNEDKIPGLCFTKGDGTTQVFFDEGVTRKLFEECGFVPAEGDVDGMKYHCNRIVNRKNGKRMDKVFINGTFRLKQ